MDAAKFVKEYLRMCSKFSCCEECPAFMTDFCTVNVEEQSPESAEKIVVLVEKWSKENLRKTRQSVFLEHYPDAPRDKDNLLKACPNCVDANVSCVVDKNATVKKFKRCDVCRREFWMQEVE